MKVPPQTLLTTVICILISKAFSAEEAEDNNIDKTVEFLPVDLLPNDTYVESGSVPDSNPNNSNNSEKNDGDTVDIDCHAQGSFGCPCNRTNLCDPSKLLECIDDTCYCMNSLHRMYDYDLEECVNLVASPCSPDHGPKCIQNSQCIRGTCKCNFGFSESSNRMCFLNIGQKCGPRQCASEKGLACKNQLCQCLDSLYTYSILADRCINPAEMVRNFVNKIGVNAAEEVVDRKIRKAIDTGMNILTFPLRLVPFVG